MSLGANLKVRMKDKAIERKIVKEMSLDCRTYYLYAY